MNSRLVESKKAYCTAEFAAGEVAGEKFANEEAEYSELRLLTRYRAVDVENPDPNFSEPGFIEDAYIAMYPDSENPTEDAQEFWANHYGVGHVSGQLVCGCLLACLNVLDSISETVD